MKTTNGTDRIDNVLGVFMHNRAVYQTTSGKPVKALEFYALRKPPGEDQWTLLTVEEAALFDMEQAENAAKAANP